MQVSVPYIESHPLAGELLSRAQVLYTDLDGTLLGRGGSVLASASGEPTLETVRAITRLNAEDLAVVPVSGRNRLQLAEITRLLGWHHGFIAEIGCVVVPGRGEPPVYFTGDWPEDALLPGETPFGAIERVGAYELLTRAFPGRIEHHTPYHLNREATFVLRGNIDADAARDDLASLELPVALVDNGIIHPPATTLRGVTEVHAYHLAPGGVSKTRAVARDIARRGLERAGAVSIGDSATDVWIAGEVGLAVLVANALDDPRVGDAIEALAARDPQAAARLAVTHGSNGEGWAEMADAWLTARG